jgi:serine/threonine protein phosphatase PrpC
VSNVEFQQAANGKPLDQACKELIELAKSRGGHDNITVQLIRVASDKMRKTLVQEEPATKSAPEPVAAPEPEAQAVGEKDSEA